MAVNKQVDPNDNLAQVGAAFRMPNAGVVESYASIALSVPADQNAGVLVSAPGANKQIWVLGLAVLAATADGTMQLQDGTPADLTGVMEITRRGGIVLPHPPSLQMPWATCGTDQPLTVTTATCAVRGILCYGIADVTPTS